jgi:hypothetical protein
MNRRCARGRAPHARAPLRATPAALAFALLAPQVPTYVLCCPNKNEKLTDHAFEPRG